MPEHLLLEGRICCMKIVCATSQIGVTPADGILRMKGPQLYLGQTIEALLGDICLWTKAIVVTCQRAQSRVGVPARIQSPISAPDEARQMV